MAIQSFQELKSYGLRRLGGGVINVEISDDQQDDLAEDALEKFGKYHYEGFSGGYAFVDGVVGQSEYTLDSSIIAVTHILSGLFSNFGEPTFTVQWEFIQQAGYIISDIDMVTYDLLRMHLRELEIRYKDSIQFFFNPLTHKLKMYPAPASVRRYALRVYMTEDPYANPDIYNNDWLKEYVEALFWKQWGANIGKYESVPLPGGAMLTGSQMWDRGLQMKEKLEEDLMEKWGEPPEIVFG